MEAIAIKKFNSNLNKMKVVADDELLIYRTDISTRKREKMLQSFFDDHPHILDWNIDRQDIDNVLRIEISKGIDVDELLGYIRMQGLHCEELED